MVLSDQQIERYARQIILPGIGGRGQEKLLASRLYILGFESGMEASLAYLVGAGIGKIFLQSLTNAPGPKALDQRMNILNPDSSLTWLDPGATSEPKTFDALLLIITSANAHMLKARYGRELWQLPTVAVRTADPCKIVTLPKTPPCLECLQENLFDALGERAEYSELALLMAVTEMLKLCWDWAQKRRPELNCTAWKPTCRSL